MWQIDIASTISGEMTMIHGREVYREYYFDFSIVILLCLSIIVGLNGC